MKYILNRDKFIKESNEHIESICMKLGILDFEIVDGLVNVNGDVILYKQHLYELPIQFGRVTGDFNCYDNRLLTLKGCPSYVGGDFICSGNRLSTLKGCPTEVCGCFECNDCEIESLKFAL